MKISGQIVDIKNHKIYPGEIHIHNGRIASIKQTLTGPNQYIMPGFIDAHVHIESSMLVPSEFARLAVLHGTVATVSDPHEIGNVLGIKGVEYMIKNGRQVNFKFFFGAPSCVPATPFETAGATISTSDIDMLLQKKEIKYLAEMMNWPGVLNNDPEVMQKIALATKSLKPVDGHAPGLKGQQALQYIQAGISTDHECFTYEEALDKLQAGMKIIIREGSAAKNFDALIPLINDHWQNIMFCSDDKHPDSLLEGHINILAKRAITCGADLFKVLQATCINPIKHYNLEVGMLKEGDPADFIVVNNLSEFKIIKTFINGNLVAEQGKTLIPSTSNQIINNFNTDCKISEDFQLKALSSKVRVINAIDGELITHESIEDIHIENGLALSNPAKDILKIAVVNRYQNQPPVLGFIKNFGLKKGAIAASVAHDSHNIIAVGVDDISICKATNLIIQAKGGMVAVNDHEEKLIPLPVAGLMSASDGFEVARQYVAIDQTAKNMGSKLNSPFMTLSFMALLVIPSLKLSDKGLFNGENFSFCKLWV
jgi:adenine deaminase